MLKNQLKYSLIWTKWESVEKTFMPIFLIIFQYPNIGVQFNH